VQVNAFCDQFRWISNTATASDSAEVCIKTNARASMSKRTSRVAAG